MAKFKVNHKQGIHLYKSHLGFYLCSELHNSYFLIYKWNPMIWDHDSIYLVHINYHEKKSLKEKISKLCKIDEMNVIFRLNIKEERERKIMEF